MERLPGKRDRARGSCQVNKTQFETVFIKTGRAFGVTLGTQLYLLHHREPERRQKGKKKQNKKLTAGDGEQANEKHLS